MISLLDIKDKLNNALDFLESKNYYYDSHICKSGESVKIQMDYKLRDDVMGEIVKFGFCPLCGTCCYHNDFDDN